MKIFAIGQFWLFGLVGQKITVAISNSLLEYWSWIPEEERIRNKNRSSFKPFYCTHFDDGNSFNAPFYLNLYALTGKIKKIAIFKIFGSSQGGQRSRWGIGMSKIQIRNFWNLTADLDSLQKSMNAKCSSFFHISLGSLSNSQKTL